VRRALPLAGQLLVPDPQVLWQPGAQLALARLLGRRFDVVWITGPPFSQFLLAPLARLRSRPPPGCDRAFQAARLRP
jgi:hypothetical protein